MFTNFKAVSSLGADSIQISLSWEWKYEPGKPMPSCKAFCCTIPEASLVGDSIFTNDEILQWVTDNILDIIDPETRVANIEAYCSDVSNKKRVLNKYELTGGSSIFCTQQLIFPASDIDKIFIICVYGGETFESRVLAVNTEREISYQIQKPMAFLPFGGTKLKFSEASTLKRRVLITKYKGQEIYSVIPEGERLSITKNLEEASIERIVFLSSLIGN